MNLAIQSSVRQVASADVPHPAIELRNLSHRYSQRLALDDVSFQVKTAEIFGLLGPNGSGKTTLFRILSTLMLPESGKALVGGIDAAAQPRDVRQQIGIVFQSSSLDVKLTAEENLRHQGHLYGITGSALQQRIDEMLKRVGLNERASERVERFSGGMQRRLELAKGLLHQPKVLLLDEPTTGLDPGARLDLWQYLKLLRDEEQVSVLITTHLMGEAEDCDRLAVLNAGRVVALGTPAELKSEIGGDVIEIEAANAESLAQRLQQRFGVAAKSIDGRVRLESTAGHRFATEIVEAFPGQVTSISISKPRLEDVFIRHTGHRFWSEPEALESK